MNPQRREFLQDMLAQNVLTFGDFQLKSGRQAPYFFDFGRISSGPGLVRVGRHFARVAMEFDPIPEVVFGPAYKGIPLGTALAIGLAEMGVEVDLAFNRKEPKGHGEGGSLVGGAMDGRNVLIVDDVVSDGAAKLKAGRMVRGAGGQVIGVLVAMDREEPGDSDGVIASQRLACQLGVKVKSLGRFSDLIELMRESGREQVVLERLLAYRRTLGLPK